METQPIQNLDDFISTYGKEYQELFRITSRNSTIYRILHPYLVNGGQEGLKYPVLVTDSSSVENFAIVTEDNGFLIQEKEQQ